MSLLYDEHKCTRHSYRVVLTLFVNEIFCHSYSEYLEIFDMINCYSFANIAFLPTSQDATILPSSTMRCHNCGSSVKVNFLYFIVIWNSCFTIIQTKLHISTVVFCVPHVWEHYYWTLTRIKPTGAWSYTKFNYINNWKAHYWIIEHFGGLDLGGIALLLRSEH